MTTPTCLEAVTPEAAFDRACVERQMKAREEMDWLEEYRRPGEIVFGPVIESRPVGEWTKEYDQAVLDAR